MTDVDTSLSVADDPELTPVIDVHVHAFPPEIVDNRDQIIRQDVWFGTLYGNPRAKLITAEDLISSMNRAGIQRSIMCGFPWRDQYCCRQHNEYMADAARRYPSRLSWLGIVSPEQPLAAQEVAWCFENGARGLGEFNADAQGFNFAEPESFDPVVDICQSVNLPLLCHVSEPLGHLYPGKGTASPERFIQFISRFPNVQVIAAHWGGGLPFYELMPEVRELAKNVVYDSGASQFLYQFDVFQRVIELVGKEKVLFGSDYPVLNQRRFRKRVESISLERSTSEHVMWRNAARVLRLNESGEQL